MSIEKGKAYLSRFGIEDRVREFDVSSATVELAAQALGVKGQRIAKSLSFKVGDEAILVIAAGDAKVDNKKYKATFSTKAKMLTSDEVESMIGHKIGGVCPFAVPEEVKVYLDRSLLEHETVFPACGSANSAIELTCEELYRCANAVDWVDISK